MKLKNCYEMEKKYKKCEICRKNTNVKEKYLLARFPLDKERCKKWVKAIGIPELARLTIAQLHYSHFVCGKHFSDNHFRSKNSRLKFTAIPTLHLLNPPLSDTLLENFPGKKHLPNTINVTLQVENGITHSSTYNFLAEHNYFQRIDPSKCDTIAQTDIFAKDKKSHSTPLCSSAVDMSENETRKEIEMENPGATTAETDADIDDVTEDYSAPYISSSPAGMSEDLNRKIMDINAAVLTRHSPDPTPSSVQSDLANHSSNVIITNPDPTPSSIQSAVANHSSNVTITNQGPTPSSVQSAVANHSSNVNITNPDPTTSSILSTMAKRTSKSMRKLPVTKVDNEEIKKLRADLVKQYRKKTAQKLKETRTKLREAQKKLWAIESIKSPLLKSLIESEISNRKKKANGKRWSTFTKCLALALYKRSPQAYAYLEKLLPLPTIRTLQKVFQEFQQGAAVNALEQLQPQTEDFQAADTLVFPSADTIVEPLPYEE
ncbi:uncharacterized protein LOC121727995 [Aricia agestis]|uniref:uncharacterized protein LOC121727995 n=1 Tax=Aricia agestis TaxID=91739 RepID=UPI001C207E26|nr:uncharacterized protein LOC121727995 [Aricia agestis]